MADVILIRHGETEWSATGRHTSTTDLPLTERGQAQARALAASLAGHRFTAVITSPRLRARRTAELAGLTVTGVDPDLAEWDYGRLEGRTTPQIHAESPGWNLWTDGAPGGESPGQISDRVDRVLDRVRTLLPQGDVALVSHAHALRVLAARWVGLPASGGGLFRLDTATRSVLGFEHGRPVITRWNATARPPAADCAAR